MVNQFLGSFCPPWIFGIRTKFVKMLYFVEELETLGVTLPWAVDQITDAQEVQPVLNALLLITFSVSFPTHLHPLKQPLPPQPPLPALQQQLPPQHLLDQ